MLPIGLTNWLFSCSRRQERGGMTRYLLRLIPQYQSYRILTTRWYGLQSEDAIEVVRPPIIEIADSMNTWEASVPKNEALLINRMARETAIQVIGEALRHRILAFGFILTKDAAVNLTGRLIMEFLQAGTDEGDGQILDEFDLSEDMRRQREEFDRQKVELNRRIAEERSQQLGLSAAAIKTSLELLRSCLSAGELREMEVSRQISVMNDLGIFVVPVRSHGFTRHYDLSGEYVQSLCLVFRDRLPYGDEILMKVLLLKSDPVFFIKKANKFPAARSGTNQLAVPAGVAGLGCPVAG
jgi:hypothetical protein